jgi:AraC-like DNA-binding protein
MAALQHPSSSIRRYAGEYGSHAHAHAQVLLGVRGCLQLEVAGRASFVDASCGLVIPAGVAHAYLAHAPAAMRVIDAPAALAEAWRLDRVRRFRVAAAMVCGGSAWETLAAIDAAPRLFERRRLDLDALEAAVDSALHEQWPTVRMALRCCLSTPRFHARMLEVVRLTPQSWLRQRRLDRACALLRQGLGLEAVALMVGYRTASALAFALRRERGIGARALRRPPAAGRSDCRLVG